MLAAVAQETNRPDQQNRGQQDAVARLDFVTHWIGPNARRGLLRKRVAGVGREPHLRRFRQRTYCIGGALLDVCCLSLTRQIKCTVMPFERVSVWGVIR